MPERDLVGCFTLLYTIASKRYGAEDIMRNLVLYYVLATLSFGMVVFQYGCNSKASIAVEDYSIEFKDSSVQALEYYQKFTSTRGSSLWMYSSDKTQHIHSGDELEIIWSRNYLDTVEHTGLCVEHIMLGVKRKSERKYCYYIKWSNRESLFNGEEQRFPPKYEWGVGATTKYVETNLSKETLQKLYPNFNGRYYQSTCKDISVDGSMQFVSSHFLEKIRFNEVSILQKP